MKGLQKAVMGIFENGLLCNINELAKACRGKAELINHETIKGFSIDSRKIEKGFLYIAIVGERLDGHDFIADAVNNGAVCVLCSRKPDNLACNYVIVEDTTKALGILALEYKNIIGAKAIAVTGSVGKTTTKQLLYSLVNEAFVTGKTEGNFNNEIGLPLTLLNLERGTEYIILEMGMNHKGEMHRLSLIGEPIMACITNIGNSHIENLGSRENIAKEKLSVSDGLKEPAWLILNGDEPLLQNQSDRYNTFYVALNNENADMRACNITEYSDRTEFDCVYENKMILNVVIPTVGKHNVLNALFAIAVGIKLGIDEETMKKGLLKFNNTGSRLLMYDKNGLHIIEDCYNASPESMIASLEVLKNKAKEHGGRAVAVLGDMKELGDYSPALHKKVGEKLAELDIDLLFAYGNDAKNIVNGALEYNSIRKKVIEKSSYQVYNIECEGNSNSDFAKMLKLKLMDNDTVLFKASRAMKLEDVIKELLY